MTGAQDGGAERQRRVVVRRVGGRVGGRSVQAAGGRAGRRRAPCCSPRYKCTRARRGAVLVLSCLGAALVVSHVHHFDPHCTGGGTGAVRVRQYIQPDSKRRANASTSRHASETAPTPPSPLPPPPPRQPPTWVPHRQDLANLLHLYLIRVLPSKAQVVADLQGGAGARAGWWDKACCGV